MNTTQLSSLHMMTTLLTANLQGRTSFIWWGIRGPTL
jgi:hypothetical protein